MHITEMRRALEEIRQHAQQGDLGAVQRAADDALSQLGGDELLTTTEAALVLGIRSVNTLKLLVRRLKIPYVMHGNRMMIPLAEVERLQNEDEVGAVRASDRLHDESAGLGGDAGLNEGELADLERGRPGRLPWKTEGGLRSAEATSELPARGSST